MTNPGSHVREHNSVLASIEKRLLEQMARRIPCSVTPDHLTVLGLVAMLAAGASFAAVRITPWASVGVIAALAVNWFGDSLDGTLARVRHSERPRYGFYVDHAIDLIGITSLCAGMACSGRMTPLVAMVLLAAYLLVAAESFLATHSAGIFRISFAGFGPTELRIVLAVGAVFMARHPIAHIGGGAFWLFDVGGIVAAVGLSAVFVMSAVRNTRQLYRAEAVPRASKTTEPAHVDDENRRVRIG
jgi:archaetidylinositol phosphate synthase